MIRRLQREEVENFCTLAAVCGYVFGSPAWLDVVRPSIFGIFNKGGLLTGGFVAAESKLLGRRVLRTPLYYPSVGPFFLSDASNPARLTEVRRRILTEMAEYLQSLGPIAVHLCLDRIHRDMLPFVWNGYKATPGYTYLLDLKSSEDVLLSSMSAKRRSELRKVDKDGIVVEETDDIECIERIVALTFDRQDKEYPSDLLHRLLSKLRQQDNWYAARSMVRGEVASVGFCLYSKDTAYYLFGGYNAQLKSAQAGPAVLWKLIRMAMERGLKTFDFEGSMVPAIERFYSDFGGTLTPYFRISRAWYPLECALKVKWRDSF